MIVCLTLIAISAVPACMAATLNVDPAGGLGFYTTIQDAVNASSTGDIIQVSSGTYNENVNVSKAITLMGVDTGAGLPVVNGSGNTAINITVPGVTVQGFTVTGSTNPDRAGIYVNPGANDNTITDINASGNYYGIYIEGANNNTITGNTANNNNVYGIVLNDNANNNLTGIQPTQRVRHNSV
jgi:parallel beta-helix repeat (two copies)/parallel beta-helix repeat (two copies)